MLYQIEASDVLHSQKGYTCIKNSSFTDLLYESQCDFNEVYVLQNNTVVNHASWTSH